MSSIKNQIIALKSALSAARINTYEIAAGTIGNEDLSGLNLYLWNAQISGEFLTPLHICEVVIRNAVADAIGQQYGDNWPWSKTFQMSLPSPLKGYNPRKNLYSVLDKETTVGKIIPELNFIFWQNMFTKRYDERLWDRYLFQIMPGCDISKPLKSVRHSIYKDIENVRRLRNRIAHHEHILNHNLVNDYNTIIRLITYRSQITADWIVLHHDQKITEMLLKKPKYKTKI